MQSRHVLPGWFGVGYALEQFAANPERERLLQTMTKKFAFFSDLIGNVEIGMAKADLTIARRYAAIGANDAKKCFLLGEEVSGAGKGAKSIVPLEVAHRHDLAQMERFYDAASLDAHQWGGRVRHGAPV